MRWDITALGPEHKKDEYLTTVEPHYSATCINNRQQNIPDATVTFLSNIFFISIVKGVVIFLSTV